jgi:N-acetylglucosaminyldiphosphoundecaprenol N-acetyl-beta-D-mannosaminyltransferase
MHAQKINLLGVKTNVFTQHELLEYIKYAIIKNKKFTVISLNLHSVYLSVKYTFMKSVCEPGVSHIDGLPIVYMGKILGYPLNRLHRITWVDLMDPFLQMLANNNSSVYYLGGDENTVTRGISLIKKKYPNLEIQYRNGYFDCNPSSTENKMIVAQINSFKPKVLMVGMGMLRQEKWILENFNDLDCNAIMTCGAAIEYIAGKVSTPPRWMGRTGLEWAYRFFENPKRFWYRYLVEPWFVLGLFMRDICKKYILRKPL